MLRHRINVGRHHIQRIGPVGLQFLPTDIEGLQLWLDANDAATLFQDAAGTIPAGAGDVVGHWADKSGLGNDATQSTTALKPTLQFNIVNGLPVVRGDVTDDVMGMSIPSVTNETLFFVISHAVNNAVGVVMASSLDENRPTYAVAVNTLNYRYNSVNTAVSVPDETAPIIVIMKHDGTNASIAINGGTPVVAAVASIAHVYNLLFARALGNQLHGDIGEGGIYDDSISSAGEASLLNYLSNKWGITLV